MNAVDLDYRVTSGPTVRYFETEEGVRRMASRPSYAKCASAALNPGGIFNVVNNIGRWFCLQTDDGRYARLKITGYTDVLPKRLYVIFKVWCKPGDGC